MHTGKTLLLRTIYYVGPLLLWMGFIFAMSTDRGSAAHTEPVVRSLLLRLWPDAVHHLTADEIGRIDWDIRKAAHITEYTILGLLAFRALAYGNPAFRSRNIVLTLLIGIGYAASDEYHQSFVPSRGAAAGDVLFDSYGILVAIILSLWAASIRNLRRP